MKTKVLLFVAIAIVFSSCTVTSFYQVYKAKPIDNTTLQENKLVYEDDNCKVSYNLWSNGGNIGFQFFNKTDKNLYLNLDQCFFVLNGVSYNYFLDRVYTSSSSSGINSLQSASVSRSFAGINYSNLFQSNSLSASSSVGVISASGYSVSYKEEKVVCVPSKTSKPISEYSINKTLYRDCNLLKYPSAKKVKVLEFNSSDSPLVFSNRISYTLGESTTSIKFENSFYVSEISNQPEDAVMTRKPETFCNESSTLTYMQFKKVAPDMFYYKYTKGKIEELKH